MLSATGIAAVIAIIAVASNVFEADPTVPGQAGATHVVAADGSADFATIQAAVDAAAEGDTIALKPGRYTEAVVIDKAITLTGDGPREEIVITAPDDGPVWEVGKEFRFPIPDSEYAILVHDADATVSGLTLQGEPSRLFLDGGAPVAEDLYFLDAGQVFKGSAVAGSVIINGDTQATVRDSLFEGGGTLYAFGHANVVIEGNELISTGAIAGEFGSDSRVEGNRIVGEGTQGIAFLADTRGSFIGNTIEDRATGITPGQGINVTDAHAPLIEGNTISGADTAIRTSGRAGGTIRGNTVEATLAGISLNGTDATVEGNTVTGSGSGILVLSGGTPTITGNTVDVDGAGISIGGASGGTVEGNTVCGAAGNIDVADGASPTIGDNELCGEATTK